MNKFYSLEPEVAGGWGKHTEADVSVRPPIVRKLHYEFDGWLGDELLESFPCFIVSQNLARAIEEANLVGATFGPVEISCSPEFIELYPDVQLPTFLWLQVNGTAGQSDFGLSDANILIVSQRSLSILREHTIENCIVTEWVSPAPG